jgi:hypothetical protein
LYTIELQKVSLLRRSKGTNLNDSKEMNEMNEIMIIENNEMRSKEEAEYVLKDELPEDENLLGST